MPTIVFVHAHPDDEASQTAGAMARAAGEGSRVVVVFATHGEHGTVPADLLVGESIADRRRVEAERSAAALGVARIEWLGYTDSGMTGWEQNAHTAAFTRADTTTAALKLAAILDREDADIVVGYDWHGGYGHPDHVKVHLVVREAARLAACRPRLLEATMNRDLMRAQFQAAKAAGMADDDWDPDQPADDGNPIGSTEDEITWQVDVRDYLAQRRAALAAHASQAEDAGAMLAMPEEAFAAFFALEHYIEPGADAGMAQGWPFGAA